LAARKKTPIAPGEEGNAEKIGRESTLDLSEFAI
jgi:hypothetical protein